MTDEEMAALHALCFDGTPRAWSAAEFAEYRADTRVLVCEAASGFVIARVVADEAEILTLAVHPDARRLGLASALLAEVESQAGAKGAVTMFLEVRDDNLAAKALYDSAGYVSAGYRKNYYQAAGRQSSSAIVLKKRLS
jgi:[ribosomal protein S18]-alanine N-acetyltransferase